MKGPEFGPLPRTGKQRDLQKLKHLVSHVQGGSLEAGAELFHFVMAAAEPYLRSTVQLEHIESDLEEVVAITWDAIRNRALIREDFLPSFVETLIWQKVRLYLVKTGQPIPAAPGLQLIPGGRGGRRRRSAPPDADPLLAPQ